MSNSKRDLDSELTDELASFIEDLHDSEIKARSAGSLMVHRAGFPHFGSRPDRSRRSGRAGVDE